MGRMSSRSSAPALPSVPERGRGTSCGIPNFGLQPLRGSAEPKRARSEQAVEEPKIPRSKFTPGL